MQQSAMDIPLRRAHAADDSRKMRPMIPFLPIVLAFASLAFATANARADAETQREDQFKAAYVVNFVKFVEWPPGAMADTLTICFVGGEGVYSALTVDIANKRVGQRRLAALQLIDPPVSGTCNALYLDASMAPGYPLRLEPALLTISDSNGFASNGGMIGLFTENHRLRFIINLQNANTAGLRISSELLKLAVAVKRESP